MIYKLLNCNTIKEFNDFGAVLICSSSQLLLEDLQKKQYIFSVYDLWSEDLLNNYTLSDLNFNKAINVCKKEHEDKQVLHRLQLLGKCCPAMSSFIKDVLDKIMY